MARPMELPVLLLINAITKHPLPPQPDIREPRNPVFVFPIRYLSRLGCPAPNANRRHPVEMVALPALTAATAVVPCRPVLTPQPAMVVSLLTS